MRITELFQPLYEEYLTSVEIPRLSRELGSRWLVDVMKNPTRKELNKLNVQKYDVVRAFVVGNDLLAWNVGEGLHMEMATVLKLDISNVIPLLLYVFQDEGHAKVTDMSRKTVWHHNPKTADVLRRHHALNNMFRKIEVSYYDQDEVGDWEEMQHAT